MSVWNHRSANTRIPSISRHPEASRRCFHQRVLRSGSGHFLIPVCANRCVKKVFASERYRESGMEAPPAPPIVNRYIRYPCDRRIRKGKRITTVVNQVIVPNM
ncbi:MAG: hypothetical protein HW377_962 [Actinobacteria bacterium]|nr:hypothetical protein [Actinomycetota bacterium]